MSDSSVNNTPAPSGGSLSAPSSAPSESREHWLPRTAGILCATALVAPTALRLPELFAKCAETPWGAILFVVAVGAPAAVPRLISLIQARGGK